jgi:hypothetical protein
LAVFEGHKEVFVVQRDHSVVFKGQKVLKGPMVQMGLRVQMGLMALTDLRVHLDL